MKKSTSMLAMLALATSMILSSCSSTQTGSASPAATDNKEGAVTSAAAESTSAQAAGSAAEEIKDLVLARTSTRELETFIIVQSQKAQDFENLTNLYDSLLEADIHGVPGPGIAKEWGSDDGGITWTFKLRDNVKWVDRDANVKADCTAVDFATGLEFVLNYHKNESSNTSMPIELIKGASEYYEYTKALPEEEAKALDLTKFYEMVGVQVPDDYTITYTCIEAKPYFDSVATYACLYPVPQGLIDELGVDGYLAADNESIWYNGCYTMTTYIPGNEKVFTKNPLYWDTDCKLFDTVTVKMVESNDVAYQLYQSGEIDYVELTESNLKTIYDSESHPYHNQLVEKRPTKYSYSFHLNYDKYTESGEPDTNWNAAIANKAFRLAWYYGLDLSEYYKRINTINPLKCENNFYTMKGLVYTSDGRDYTELVKEGLGIGDYNGETMVRFDKEKAEAYKKQAIEELTAKGVTFPVGIDYYIAASNQTSLDSATVLKQAFSNSLGDDFVVLNIKTYVSSSTKEVTDPRLQSFLLNGWGADYGDPQNYLGQETYGEDNAFYSIKATNINDATNEELINTFKEFTAMVKAADAIHDDLDKRYQAYADAEVFFIENALAIPCYYNITWILTHINEYSKINAMFGSQNDKFKNWETSVEGYTTEQFEAFEAAFEQRNK